AQPLGRYVGNALEVVECVEVLKGTGPADLVDLSLELAAWMIYLGDAATSVEEAKELSAKLIANGAAFKKFAEIVRLQGGNEKALDDLSLLPQAQNRVDIPSAEAGQVTGMDCEKVGIASLVLGGGRERKEDDVDHAVGIVLHKKVGDKVAKGEALCTLYYNGSARLEEARELITASYRIGPALLKGKQPLIHRVMGHKS
ncbi:MAG TPA: hypothetical protein VJ723_14270, partial [Candidatus Angelobacter sp.]|nr:hypothetical protein [Candidatus Angelobacter sp.]